MRAVKQYLKIEEWWLNLGILKKAETKIPAEENWSDASGLASQNPTKALELEASSTVDYGSEMWRLVRLYNEKLDRHILNTSWGHNQVIPPPLSHASPF